MWTFMKGFKVEGKSSAIKPQRLGRLGMRERVEMLGGTFRRDSAPGHPTTVRVELPAATDTPPRSRHPGALEPGTVLSLDKILRLASWVLGLRRSLARHVR